MAREAMKDLGRSPDEIADVTEPPGADYAVISFTNPEFRPPIPRVLPAWERS